MTTEATAVFSSTDHVLMAQALRLAERGRYTTRPNPMVGCVIAQGETVVGEGWHQRKGEPHAEILALQAAGEQAKGATAYVTLEPCLMCTGAIELSRIHALYYGTSDPKGGTVDTLIQVKKIPHLNTYPKEIHPGILQEECAEILSSFFREKRKLNKLKKAEKR